MPSNKSIKFAHKTTCGLGLGDTARLAPYFKRYVNTKYEK